MAANTLTGFFRDALTAQKCSAKYFNRAFLVTFIDEYKASKKAGAARYPRTIESKFYRENGPAYCVFLELWQEYNERMERLRGGVK